MYLLVSLFISLITLLTPCASSSVASTTMERNSIISSNIVESATLSEGLHTIYFNDHTNYLGLDDATCFTLSSSDLYFATNTSLYSYSFNNKTLTKILDCDNIEDLSYSINQLFVFKNSKLYKVVSNNLVEYKTCDMYSIYTYNNATYLSMLSANIFTTIRIDTLSEVTLWEDTIPSSYSPIAIANSNTTAYIVAEQNSSTMILEKNFQQKTTTVYGYNFNIDNISYWKDVDGSAILVYYTNDNLRTITKHSDNESYIDVFTKILYNHGKHGFEIGLFYTIKDLYINQNHLYLLDEVYSSIQKFEYSTDIKFVDVVTSSSAYTAGKFYNPQSFAVVDKETLVVADTYNQAIQVIDGTTSTLIKNYTNNTTKTNFNYVTRVIKTNTNYFVLQHDSLDNFEILILDKDFNLIKNIAHSLTDILDIAIINDNLYILDANTTSLYRYTNDIIENTNISPIALSNDSKMHYIIETNTLAISNTASLYLIDMSDKSIETYTHDENIKSVTSDYMGYAYILSDTKITRINSADHTDNTKKANITLTSTNYTHISAEKETGILYLFDSKNQCFEALKTNKTYSLSSDYTHPININEYLSDKVVNIGSTNENVFVYTYPYSTGLSYNISNKTVYILAEVNNYYYVAYRRENIDTYSNLGLGYISKDNIISIKTYTEKNLPQSYKVLSNTAIYPLPTMLATNGSVMTIGSLTKGTVVRSTYDLLDSTHSIDGCDYYIVATEDGIGYVKKVDLVSVTANETVELLKPNAKLVVSEDKYNGVYLYAGNSSLIIDKLLVGQEIFVENYDINAKYTYIRYLDENNIEHGGYVLTKCIQMNDSGSTNIGAIILIVLAVIAVAGVTTFYIISYRKQQKDLTNSTKQDFE